MWKWLLRLWNRLRNPRPISYYFGEPVIGHLASKESNLPKEGVVHKHKCNNCGTIWEHSDNCAGDITEHTCPNCGSEQWMRYNGNEPVSSPDPYPSYTVNEEENPFLFRLK